MNFTLTMCDPQLLNTYLTSLQAVIFHTVTLLPAVVDNKFKVHIFFLAGGTSCFKALESQNSSNYLYFFCCSLLLL